ncbi:hypothetical protein [Bradyrhizobium sp. SYSU BS000235]|uniref:hypothetical protein n=1 Tax=Bradyrhizobium sp. SYSU BS000235 TaxID=3411332 RepID=UPI003C747434
MGIDRWKQEHRNWRPSGVKVVVPEMQPEEPPAALIASEKTSSAAKKANSSASRAASATDKAQPKRSKR